MASTLDLPVWFNTETTELPHPEQGTINLGTEHLTFKGSSVRANISLSSIKDIRTKRTLQELGPIPPEQVPITLVYDGSDGTTAAAIAAKSGVIQPFTVRLLETILSGEPVRVRHPAWIGQEPTSVSSERGTLDPTDSIVHLGTDEDARIDMENIVSFTRADSSSSPKHLVKIAYVREKQQYQTAIQMTNRRAVSIFGRYLNIQKQFNAPNTDRPLNRASKVRS